MQIRAGDYIVWYDSAQPPQDIGFSRPGGDLRFPNGDEKYPLYFIKTADDFQELAQFIGEIVGLYIKPVSPERVPSGAKAMWEFCLPAR